MSLKGADVVVVGAGCVGANVAYRLAERGATVTVLDAGAPGAGTSGASFAWTNSFNKTPRDYHDLNVSSMEEHAVLAKELGGGGWLHQDGALAWEEGPAGLARLGQAVERLAGWGYAVERISPRQARELEPDLHIAPGVEHVVWTPGEGYVEAVPFIGALLAEATRRGARILPGRRVTGVIRSGARVQGVSTEGGDRFEAQVVVDCAGVAMDEIARLAGVAIPIDRVPGRLIYTAPVATTLRRPIHAPGCHFGRTAAGASCSPRARTTKSGPRPASPGRRSAPSRPWPPTCRCWREQASKPRASGCAPCRAMSARWSAPSRDSTASTWSSRTAASRSARSGAASPPPSSSTARSTRA